MRCLCGIYASAHSTTRTTTGIALMSVIVSRCERVIAPKMVIIFIEYCPRDIMNAMCSNFCFTTHSPCSVHRKVFSFAFSVQRRRRRCCCCCFMFITFVQQSTVYDTLINIHFFRCCSGFSTWCSLLSCCNFILLLKAKKCFVEMLVVGKFHRANLK